MLTGKILNITNKNELDFIKIKYQKEYSLKELDNFIRKILKISREKKEEEGQDLNFKVKLIILDRETKAIRFDMKKDETLQINASLPEDTTLRTLLEEEIEIQRYDMANTSNFDDEKKKFLEDFDESYKGKVSKDLDEKAIRKGKAPFFQKLTNILFKDNSKKSEDEHEHVTSLKDAFEDEDKNESEKVKELQHIEELTPQKNEEDDEGDEDKEESFDDSINELWEDKNNNDSSSDNQQLSQHESTLTNDENSQVNIHSKTLDSESHRVQAQPPKNPSIPIDIPKYTEKEIILKHSDDPFEQKQNEYIYDRLLNKESYKASLYEELGHRLEYQFVVYVNDKRKHIEKVKNDNEMSQEEFDHLSNNISQQVQKDIDQNVKEYVKGQENKLKNFTQQQEKVLEEFKTKQHQELTQQKESMEKEKQNYLKDTEEERVMRVSSEQMQMMEENERKINVIVAEENQTYDFKIQEALNEDCKQLIDEIDEKLFKFDDETYQQLLHKRETWKEELNKAKQLEIQEEQAKNEQLKIQQNIKKQEAIIAQQQQEEQEIKRIREEKEKLAEKNKESELQLEMAKMKNEQERLAQEDRRISDSEKQTNLREQELVQSKEKNSHMTEVLMAQFMNDNKKDTPTTAQLPKPRENTKTTSESKTSQSNILKSVGIFLLSAVVLIGIFLGGFFADHYIHILNCLPITMNHTQLIEPPFQLLK